MAQKYEKFGSRNFHPDGISDTVGSHEGDVMYFGSTSVNAGRCYILDNTAECEEDAAAEECVQWTLADSDNATTVNLMAVALGNGAANSVGMLLRGMYTFTGGGVALANAGSPLYLTDDGNISATVPTGSGDYIRIVGYTIIDNKMWFNPDNTTVKLA